MTDYRIYLLNDAGHVEAPPRIVRCNDDSTALRRARKFVENHPLEIWDLARHVGTIKPTVSFSPNRMKAPTPHGECTSKLPSSGPQLRRDPDQHRDQQVFL
jgi:hypothetical protein